MTRGVFAAFTMFGGLLVFIGGTGCAGDADRPDHYSTDQLLLSEGKYYALGEVEPYTGPVINWHANGQKKYEVPMVDGVAHGTATEWHPNGHKMTEVQLEQGVPTGTMTGWHSNGAKQFEMPLREGKQHGLVTEYDPDNQRISTTRYVEGQRQGEATGFDVSGRKAWTAQYAANVAFYRQLKRELNTFLTVPDPYWNRLG